MRYRKLRIAWSVVWGLIALLLVALWVRSYTKSDGFAGNRGANLMSIYQIVGEMHFSELRPAMGITLPVMPWHMFHDNINEYNLSPNEDFHQRSHRLLGIRWLVFGNGFHFALSHLFAIVFTMAVGILPWLPPGRFSLRALLIAMTLVAVVLGAIVWAAR